MSRKTPSPMLESEMIIECDHMRHKRSMENVSFSNGIKPAPRTYQFNQYNQFNETNENQNPRIKRLTSFEELAKNSSTNSLLFVSQSGPKYEEDSDLEVPPSPMKREHFVSKPKSDYSIHYRNFQVCLLIILIIKIKNKIICYLFRMNKRTIKYTPICVNLLPIVTAFDLTAVSTVKAIKMLLSMIC